VTAIHQNTISGRTAPLDSLWLEFKGWLNPREFTGLDPEAIGEMGGSIKVKGITEPLKVAKIRTKDGIIDLVVDGQRRVLGAREVLPKSAPIPVVDLIDAPIDATKGEIPTDAVDWLLIRAFTTLEREGLSSYELVNAALRWKARGKTGEWIAKVINRSPSWVSKFLKARESASQKLLQQWRKGEITDEQFKDLAEVKDPAKQEEAVKAVVDARKSGDATEARIRAKEIKETERVVNGHGKPPVVPPVVKGGQLTLDGKEEASPAKPEPVKAKPPAPKRSAPNRLVLEEMVDVASKRPPTADYVKGLVDGVKYALGIIDPGDFGKAWRQYIARVDGSGAKAKPKRAPKKSAKKARRAAKKPSKKVRR
jgi:hypothetical protein